jgi:hypothetical protein
MAAQVRPSLDVAEPAVIRHRAREMRLAARQALGRAVQAQVQATMQSAVRVHSSPPTRGRGRGQDQPAGSLLAQLLQPLLAPPALAPAEASRAVTEPELAAVHPIATREISPGLEGSLATLRSRVQAIHRQFQLARQGTVVTRTGHLRLVPPPESAPTSRTPHPPHRAPPG